MNAINAIPIQVVFQGGGARLAELLVVCRALRRMEEDGLIRVTHCGGASAGAVAAALVSSGRQVASVEDELINVFEQHSDLLSKVKKLRLALVLFFGVSYFPKNFLSNVFDKLFDLKGKAVTISELAGQRNPSVPLSIYTTDLVTGNSMRVASGRAITDALARSCAFPLVFSGYGEGFEVDGGLASNLPVDDFLKDAGSLGEVIAFGFTGDAGQDSPNIIRYLLNLFSAAIQSGVTRSELRLSPDCNFRINSEITTFDFPKAIAFLTNRAGYERAVDDLVVRLKAWVAVRQNVPAESTALLPAPISNSPLPDWVRNFYEQATGRYDLVEVINQIVAEAEIFDSQAKKFTGFFRTEWSISFLPKVDRPLLRFTLGTGSETADMIDLKIRAFDDHGNPVSIDHHAETVTHNGNPYVQLWVACGAECTIENASPTTLKMSYTCANPYPRLGSAPEWSGLQTRLADTPVGILVLAVALERLPRTSWDITDLYDGSKMSEISNHVAEGTEFVPSESLTYAECVKYLPGAVGESEQYRIFGRRALSLKKSQVFGLAIERRKGT